MTDGTGGLLEARGRSARRRDLVSERGPGAQPGPQVATSARGEGRFLE